MYQSRFAFHTCVFYNHINIHFEGCDCGEKLQKFLPTDCVVYFHNLAYDKRFIISNCINKSVIKGTKLMSWDVVYEKKIIHFKYTLPILSCKLSHLPQMFNISNIQKEIFPYKYNTIDRLKLAVLKYSLSVMKKMPWNKHDYDLFKSNIDKIERNRIDDKHFNMSKYCMFYYEQEVTILRLGCNAFRQGFINDFNLDPYDFISFSSLSKKVYNQCVYKGHDLYRID